MKNKIHQFGMLEIINVDQHAKKLVMINVWKTVQLISGMLKIIIASQNVVG
jgi:hypothetical protein